jgi:hypothetical protein
MYYSTFIFARVAAHTYIKLILPKIPTQKIHQVWTLKTTVIDNANSKDGPQQPSCGLISTVSSIGTPTLIMPQDKKERAMAMSGKIAASCGDAIPGKRLLFTSPRLFFDDADLFPTAQSPSYQEAERRWERISSQAASHRQDGSRLTIRAKISPVALRIGLTSEARRRVTHLFLCVDEDTLVPTWLDELSTDDFPNLKHIDFIDCDCFPEEDHMAASARMRRLYVLYRLPHLVTIDGIEVTNTERRLARPNDPLFDDHNDSDAHGKDERNNDQNSDDDDDGPIATPSGEALLSSRDESETEATLLGGQGLSTKSKEYEDHDVTNLELASVASTDIEWSAACGVLSFRSDRTCAPRLRLPFSVVNWLRKPLLLRPDVAT